jgi:hypothetical protein
MSFFNGLKISGIVAVLFFALPAVAQFEVSPDHFDAEKKAPVIAHKASVHRSPATPAAQRAGLPSRQLRVPAAKRKGGANGAFKAAIRTGVSSKPDAKSQVATTGSWPRQQD